MSPPLITPALLLRKSDSELAALAAAGHEAAFTAIVLRHRAHLVRHCRGLLRDQRAEDAVQQTFVRALQSLRSGTEVRELRPWLHRIAHNVALDELRAGKRDHAPLSDDWEDASRSGEYDRRIALREALMAVEALPGRQRAALMRSVAGDTPAAIAHDLGLTSGAVRQLVHRARISVRAAVRVICPPPLVWLSRRVTGAWEKMPKGASAGAAPVASKIALAVIASATVAAPATVIHSVLTHRTHTGRPHHAITAQPVSAPAVLDRVEATGRQAVPTPSSTPPPATRATATPQPSPASTASPGGRAVSASSPGSAPVGTGSGPTSATPGGGVAGGGSDQSATASSQGAGGPIQTSSASSPTASSSAPTQSSDASPSEPSSASGSADASGSSASAGSASP